MAKARRLNKEDRRTIAKLLITTGHLAIGALLFKQAFSDEPFNFTFAILGILTFIGVTTTNGQKRTLSN